MNLDHATCYRAIASRDRRFDGRFFVAVTTTGIYCRPGCPAPTPRRHNVRFFGCAAAAAEAGFRPCARCRPELSPEIPWPGTTRTVSRALRLMADDARDGGEPLPNLAARLGIGERHLRRLFIEHLGASPSAIALTRRAHFARRLLDETDLPMAQVAYGAGFGSIRRFNDVMRRTFRRPPRLLRRDRKAGPRSHGDLMTLSLPYKPPLPWNELMGYLAARAIPGVEVVGERYARTVAIDGWEGTIALRHPPGENVVSLEIHADLGEPPRNLLALAERARRLLDLATDPDPIAAHLRREPVLARALAALPGVRVPGAWDPFEIAVRVVLGQQVSVKAATTLSGRLAQAFGRPLAGFAGLTRLFPEPETLALADLTRIGLTKARAATVRALASEVASGRIGLDASIDRGDLVTLLRRVPGIGPWTAQMIAMRALSDPDAFPAQDLGIKKALARGGRLPAAGEVEKMSQAWSPWRSYAAMLLWCSPPATKER